MNTAIHREGTMNRFMETEMESGETVRMLGLGLVRWGLVAVFVWIGAMKFTAYEAGGIQPLVSHSPLLSWVYQIWSVQGFSNLLGVAEIAIGVLIAIHFVSPLLSAIGSALAIPLFLTTLSFIFSTPGWEGTLGGFPALSVAPGQFLLKDIVLLGGSVWLLGDSMRAMARRR